MAHNSEGDPGSRFRHGIPWASVTSVTAVIVSLLAVGFAVHTAYLDRQYRRHSAQPLIELVWYQTAEGAGWKVANFGLGPGVIRWFTVSVDRKPVYSWRGFYDALGFEKPYADYLFSTLPPDSWQRPTPEPVNLFWMSAGPKREHLRRNATRVFMEICYCSIYGECWLATNQVGAHIPHTCVSDPPKPYFGQGDFP